MASPMRDETTLQRLGFMTHTGGVHASRTIMLTELSTLFDCVGADAPPSAYRDAICQQNCLAKRSGRSRLLTARHLAEAYALDPANPVYAGLRYFWARDVSARPQLALLAAAARDSLLRDTAPAILARPPGTRIEREWVEERIESRWPERFSSATRRSVAQNLNSSLTKAGLLGGRRTKIRRQLNPAIGAVAFAFYLAWLQGDRGEILLQNVYCKLLNVTSERLLELAGQASAKGWMVMRRVDNVVDVDFPALTDVVTQAMQTSDKGTAQRINP
ncbi:hypothetical protein [Arhodomonas aquaeolei]|uniref:hypothetical protein n=1 Tax=Arhodomonas TaxID=2368 RepID=UPI001469ECA6|nr:hypothetical protein [Arhodomonas aquaeolei]